MRELVRLEDGRVIGYIDGGIFCKEVYGSIHMLRKPPAWAIDVEVWEWIKLKVTWIMVTDKETNDIFFTKVETFDKHKRLLDRGHGRQYYMILDRWSKA